MDKITFKYASKIKPKYLEHLVTICLLTLDCVVTILIVRFLLGHGDDVTIRGTVITALLMSILFDFLFSFGKTTIDLSKRKVIYSQALTSPTVNIKIDEIESIHPRKHWYRLNLTIQTTTGKKRRISVDDPERFISLLSAENKDIRVVE